MKCATKGCQNRNHEGLFEGAFCSACTYAMRAGVAGNGTSWIHQQAARLAEAEQDAARYRFIRNCCEVTCLGVEIESDAHIDQYLEVWPNEPTVSAPAVRPMTGDERGMVERALAASQTEVTDSATAVQPERCCLDYPRCDCNSPPEPDDAPTLQPCGHPWKAQHDFKCILCSSPGDST